MAGRALTAGLHDGSLAVIVGSGLTSFQQAQQSMPDIF